MWKYWVDLQLKSSWQTFLYLTAFALDSILHDRRSCSFALKPSWLPSKFKYDLNQDTTWTRRSATKELDRSVSICCKARQTTTFVKAWLGWASLGPQKLTFMSFFHGRGKVKFFSLSPLSCVAKGSLDQGFHWTQVEISYHWKLDYPCWWNRCCRQVNSSDVVMPSPALKSQMMNHNSCLFPNGLAIKSISNFKGTSFCTPALHLHAHRLIFKQSVFAAQG